MIFKRKIPTLKDEGFKFIFKCHFLTKEEEIVPIIKTPK